MLHLPDPVHPFAVHFPVAFLLAGVVMTALLLLWPNGWMTRLAAGFLLAGALGATWAHQTGMAEAAAVRYVGESVVGAVREHKADADLMLWASWLAAAAGVAVVFTRRIPGVTVLVRLGAVGVCVFLLWTMQAAMHTGSELTHTHFFGPNAPKPWPGTEEVIRLRVP